MRKVGKYEKMRRNALLSSYITSILCLVLCVTMFFGTTAAWFTDTTTSQQNQIYVGTLSVDLKHATYKGGVLEAVQAVTTNEPVLNPNIKWEPGYTEVKMFEVSEGTENDLAFSYQLGIEREFGENETAQKTIAENITVWQYVGNDAATYELPTDFATMTLDNEDEWVLVGTLKQVIDDHVPVFSGKMTATEVTGAEDAKKNHLIALHMDQNYDGAITKDGNGNITSSVQGQTLNNLTIKLVATQLPSEQDAFGDTYDRMPTNIVVIKEVKKDADNKTSEALSLAATSNSAVSHASVEIPAGVQVAAEATTLALKVTETNTPKITVASDKKVLPLEIKVEGLAEGNTKVIPVKLQLDEGLTNVEVFHNGEAMTAAATKADGTFTYNKDNGELILYVSRFSPFDIVYCDDVEDPATLPWDGSTTKAPVQDTDGYYAIGSPEELAWLAEGDHELTNVKLTADIDMNGKTIDSIGLVAYGTFDGNGKTISNAVVDGTGLFENIASSVTIKNLVLDKITVNATSGAYAGIVCGKYSGTFTNLTVKNSSVSAPNSEYVGGLAGAYYKNIEGCKVENCSILGTEKVGGLVGFFTLSDVGDSVSLKNCSVSNVTVTATNTAEPYNGVIFGRGLATSSYKFTFENCSAAMKADQKLIGQDYNNNIDVSAINVTTIS